MMRTEEQKDMPRRKRLFILIVLSLAALATAGLWYLRTADMSRSLLPPCLFHAVTGLYCTGCGMTRALYFIVRGDLYEGFRMNPLAILSMPFLAWVTVLVLYRSIMKKPMPRIPTWVPWAILAVIVVYTVARNLPWEPFSWLAPGPLPWGSGQ